MNNKLVPEGHTKENQEKSQFAEKSVYVREDDQDWGSAGMNDIQQDSDIN